MTTLHEWIDETNANYRAPAFTRDSILQQVHYPSNPLLRELVTRQAEHLIQDFNENMLSWLELQSSVWRDGFFDGYSGDQCFMLMDRDYSDGYQFGKEYFREKH